MVENDKYCGDVLIQVAAARSALNSVGGLILENYTKDCLKDYLDGSANEKALDALVGTILKYTKQNELCFLTLLIERLNDEERVNPTAIATAMKKVSERICAVSLTFFSITATIV